jgi:hypothetical protein
MLKPPLMPLPLLKKPVPIKTMVSQLQKKLQPCKKPTIKELPMKKLQQPQLKLK